MICGKDRAPDQFVDLRDYGVAELFIAVYPSGNPMTCSAVSGTGYRWPSTRLHQSCQLFRSGFGTPRLGEVLPPLNVVALGVGHNPHSVPKLSGTSVGSRYAVPLRIIPERGQVSENSPHSPSKESCDVFHDDEARSNLVNQSAIVGPEPAACAVKTRSTACATDVLAGKSSSDCIRTDPVCSQLVCGKCSNIVIDGDTQVARCQAGAGLTVVFTERDGLEPARPLQPEREAADAGEQVKKTIRLAHLSSPHESTAARSGGGFHTGGGTGADAEEGGRIGRRTHSLVRLGQGGRLAKFAVGVQTKRRFQMPGGDRAAGAGRGHPNSAPNT